VALLLHDRVADVGQQWGLEPSETALILGASGGVGHAALQLADRIGAEVYDDLGRLES